LITDQTLYAGDSWEWTEEIAGYSSAEYSLKYYLKLKDAPPVKLESAPDGDGFKFSLVPDKTKIPHGTYNYMRELTKEGFALTYDTGTVTILPNLREANTDARTQWVRIYQNLTDAYERLSSQEVSEVTIDGKTWKFADRPALIREINNAKVQAGIEGGTKTGLRKRILVQPTND
jgi:hypothetical protein